MSIYDQDFNQISQELLPPSRRLDKFEAFEAVLLKPLQWLHDLVYQDYAEGTSALAYNSGTTYNKGDRIIYNNKVYESLKTQTGVSPTTNTDSNWLLLLDDWRGARRRIQYNGQHLSLEFMLNEWFSTTFVQPDYNNPGNRSQIYIDTLITFNSSFIVFDNSSQTAKVHINNKYLQTHFVRNTNVVNQYNFQVNYPFSVIPGSSSADLKYAQMAALTERYKLYGTSPTYKGY